MKTYCERCHHEITEDTDMHFEKYLVGNIKCKKCGFIQRRYISEADLQLYIALSEVLYFFLTLMGVYVYRNMLEKWWLVLIFLPILIVSIFIIKNLGRFIYNKAPGKKEVALKKMDEDPTKVKKEINIQFYAFFAIAVVYIISPTYSSEFIFGLVIAICISFIKYWASVRKEKE